jgi:PPOX class probable F420-dependent enzyme
VAVTAAIPDSHLDLLDAQVATLATVGPDGYPQLTAVWFLAEDGEIKLSLNNDRQKTKNLLENGKVTLFIIDPSGYRYLEVRGDAQVTPDEGYAFAGKVGTKYGSDLRGFDRPGSTRVQVTLVPTRVNAVDMR